MVDKIDQDTHAGDRQKYRESHGDIGDEGIVICAVTIVTEKVTPATVIIEPATVESRLRASSGPPDQMKPIFASTSGL
jgi:hypothetical protein